MNEIKINGLYTIQYVFVHFCSLDYHQPRSVTSASTDIIIDDTNDKRDNRHRPRQRFHGNRQSQFAAQSSSSASSSNTKERSYNYGMNYFKIFQLVYLYIFSFVKDHLHNQHRNMDQIKR